MTNKLRLTSLFCATFLVLSISTPSLAEDDAKNIDLPPVTQSTETGLPKETTHPILRLTPDKSELIRLDEEAASIIVGNPAHINVIADSSKTLVIVPRLPGATHFTVLGKKGQIIIQRHVIVASPKEDYVRIKRTCAEDSDTCKNTSMFYCPDMCHEIQLEGQTKDGTTQANGTSDGNAGNAEPPSGNAAPDVPDQ